VNCEVEFLPVGDGTRPGDAIVIRYGSDEAFRLMIVDGGTLEVGKQVVEHVRQHFGADTVVSHVVVTHADADHASGIREVLTGLKVERLWVHMPWNSASAALPYFASKEWTAATLANELIASYDILRDIVSIAIDRSVTIAEPFAGAEIGPFTVLSPAREIYAWLLPQFDKTPDADRTAIERDGIWIGKAPGILARLFERAAATVQKWFIESWSNERLKDGGCTSASNESSVVLYGDFRPSRPILLTGDAGIVALTLAAAFAEGRGLPLGNFQFVQIPHHGSIRNVGPTVLNRLVGPVLPEGISTSPFSAFVSAPKDDATHPRQMVPRIDILRINCLAGSIETLAVIESGRLRYRPHLKRARTTRTHLAGHGRRNPIDSPSLRPRGARFCVREVGARTWKLQIKYAK